MMEKGCVPAEYKGKSLSQINFDHDLEYAEENDVDGEDMRYFKLNLTFSFLGDEIILNDMNRPNRSVTDNQEVNNLDEETTTRSVTDHQEENNLAEGTTTTYPTSLQSKLSFCCNNNE